MNGMTGKNPALGLRLSRGILKENHHAWKARVKKLFSSNLRQVSHSGGEIFIRKMNIFQDTRR